MNLIAEKVELLGFDKYNGGLNVKENLTGTHSYYTQFQENEIMFHVATEIPYNPNDPQQLGRKKFVGNDIVVVIFCDDRSVKFSPSQFRSQFNRIPSFQVTFFCFSYP